MSRQEMTENYPPFPPPYSSPPRTLTAPLQHSLHSRQDLRSSLRPLPPLQTNNLHAAWVPQYNQRTPHQVSFAPPPTSHQNSRATGQPKLNTSYRITTVEAHKTPQVQGSPAPTNFWLPSPQTPQTLDSRKSGLQTFWLPPRKRAISSNNAFVRAFRAWMIKWFVEWWMLEILSWGVSAGCMTAIIAILAHYDKGNIPVLSYNLTLNQVVSALSGFARASLILPTAEALGQLKWNSFRREPRSMLDFERLDMASRGPWGALVLVLRFRHM